MEETISRMAGSSYGSRRSVVELEAMVDARRAQAAAAHHDVRRGPRRALGRRAARPGRTAARCRSGAAGGPLLAGRGVFAPIRCARPQTRGGTLTLEPDVSTAEHPDALTRRIEQLAAASSTRRRGAALVARRAARRGAAGRDGRGARRAGRGAGGDGLRGQRSGAAARRRARRRSRRRLAVLEDALDGLGRAARGPRPRRRSTTTSLLQGLDATVRRLPAVLAARDEDLLASVRAAQEQAARDRETTQELALAVRSTLDALSSALVDEDARAGRQRAALEAGLDRVGRR